MEMTSMFRGKALFAALSVALLLAASDARASFTYSDTSVPTTLTFGPSNTSTYTVTPAALSATLAGTQIINIAQMSQTSTQTSPPNPTDTTSFTLTLTTTINNQNGGGSGTITLIGTINITRSDTTGAFSTFALTSILPSSLTLGNFVYTLSSPAYIAPTIGVTNSNGGLSVAITETQIGGVPEPASVVMLGSGLVGVIGLGLRRMKKTA